MKSYLIIILLTFTMMDACIASKKDKIKLKDVQVLTLQEGKWTTGRRTRPVLQLKCVGGTAGCKAFAPSSVQCYNKGSDGRDIQWSCDADLDSRVKFGHIEVVCEGYDYADDDYVLVGSCGLEYTLDLVNSRSNTNRGSNYHYHGSNERSTKKWSFGFVASVVVIMFIIYYSCLRSRSGTNEPRAPPPPGFRSEFFNDGSSSSSSFGGNPTNDYRERPSQANTGFAGNGFWSGMATGGILGYLFGQRPNYTDQSSYFGTRHRTSYFNDNNDNGSSTSQTSSTTRTASGFGGTRRR